MATLFAKISHPHSSPAFTGGSVIIFNSPPSAFPPGILPSPGYAQSLLTLSRQRRTMAASAISLVAGTFIGFSIGGSIGLVLGLISGLSRWENACWIPLIQMLR